MKALILTTFEHSWWMSDLTHKYNVHYITDHDYELPKDYDIGISFMWTKKIPKEHVNSHTWFNFHPAPLPEYRGRNLCYHAIMNREIEFGASVHYMDEDFDTGDIIEVIKFPILDWWNAGDVSVYTVVQSKIQFEKYFPRILAGEEFRRYPNVGGTYYRKENIDDFINLGDDGEWLGKEIRAIYYPPHYPKIEIGGVTYKIVKEE